MDVAAVRSKEKILLFLVLFDCVAPSVCGGRGVGGYVMFWCFCVRSVVYIAVR